MGLIIAGDRSGVGKTTITLAILAWLTHQNQKIQSFKVGPDYIDPMFHSLATGIACRNLDPVLTSDVYVRDCYQLHSQDVAGTIIEGVMGLFDGINNLDHPDRFNDYGSTAHLARILNLPVALVLDCSRLSSSVAAIATGYARLDPRVQIAGVILNQVASERHLELLTTALQSIAMPILGVFRRNQEFQIPDRHLGLVPAEELPNISNILLKLAQIADSSLNWTQLLPLIEQGVGKKEPPNFEVKQKKESPLVRIGVAWDAAFNFYYQDNWDLLRQLGAELVFWSPLADQQIPDRLQGLYFGGGFPEMFAQQLAANRVVLAQLKQIILGGIPTYAECGGLMYLCQQLIDLAGTSHSMVGIIPNQVTMEAKLTLGYRQAIALETTPAIIKGQIVVGHEFHRSRLVNSRANPLWQLQGLHRSSLQLTEGWQTAQVHASYLHLHWGNSPHIPQRFIDCCRKWYCASAFE